MNLNDSQRRELLSLARQSIQAGIAQGCRTPCPAVPAEVMPPVVRSTFVTLRIGEELRGCCGSIGAHRRLAEDVWSNAWTSAFADPRFPGLKAEEYPQLNVHISVLGDLEPLGIADEAALLKMLRPDVDGLVLELGAVRSTFLPAVWEQIADPAQFVRQLKLKAGWREDFWSPRIKVSRYTAESFGEAGN
jgi:AmmeMemoRadiSam system protein A